MLKTILQTASRYAKAVVAGAIQNSGIAALYLGTSTLLAAMLLAAYLSYAWDITPDRWYRAYALLQGYELGEIQKAEQDRAAEARHEDTIARRAMRDRNEEYNKDVTQPVASYTLPPEMPKPAPPPPPSDAEEISAYVKRVKDDLAKAKSAGLDEVIRIFENMDPDQAKEAIIQHWKDGKIQRVLDVFDGMEEKRKDNILDAFLVTNEEELKILNEILQRIGDGEPMTSVIENAAKKPR